MADVDNSNSTEVTDEEIEDLVREMADKAVQGLSEDQFDRVRNWMSQNQLDPENTYMHVRKALKVAFDLI